MFTTTLDDRALTQADDLDLLAILVTPDDLDGPSGPLAELEDAVDGGLMDLLAEEFFKAKPATSVLLRGVSGLPTRRLLVVGLGEDASDIRAACARSARKAADLRATRIGVVASPSCGEAAAAQAIEGVATGAYRFTAYKTKGDDDGEEFATLARLHLFGMGEDDAAVDAASKRVRGVWRARDLVNEPPQSLVPETLAEVAVEIASTHGLESTVFDANDLTADGFNLIMAVGKGSTYPPRLIHLVYRPDGEVRHKLALVGKGVTFDTGGYNIKTGTYMYNMHSDMAGAAAVLGAAEAIGALAPAGIEVHFIVPTAENAISGDSMRPNDIYRGYGGQTVEIGNTDAEGRLILADALAYAQEQGVDSIVDLATLTGACVVALGEHTSGLFVDDDAFYAQLEQAIATSGEDYWRMPLTQKLDSQLDSHVADMKNVGKRYGGAITAGLFLKRWITDVTRWAHMDIAGPSFAESDSETKRAGGTGFGVVTLARLAELLGQGDDA